MAVEEPEAHGPLTLLEHERERHRVRQGRVQDLHRAQRIVRELARDEYKGLAQLRQRIRKAVDPRRTIDFVRGELAARASEREVRQRRLREHNMAKSKRIYEWCLEQLTDKRLTAGEALDLFEKAKELGVTGGGLHGFFYNALRPALQERLGTDDVGLTMGDIERKREKRNKSAPTAPALPSARSTDPRGDSVQGSTHTEPTAAEQLTPDQIEAHEEARELARDRREGPTERRIEGESIDPRGEDAPDRREDVRRELDDPANRDFMEAHTADDQDEEEAGPLPEGKDRRIRLDRRVKMGFSDDGRFGRNRGERRLGDRRFYVPAPEPEEFEGEEEALAELMRCRACGCTDADCSECIDVTGQPCSWVPELATSDHRPICSRCVAEAVEKVHDGPARKAEAEASRQFELQIAGPWGFFRVGNAGVLHGSALTMEARLPEDITDSIVEAVMRRFYPLQRANTDPVDQLTVEERLQCMEYGIARAAPHIREAVERQMDFVMKNRS